MLMISCMKNFPDIVEFLLSKGADPNIKADNDVTALYLAAKHGSIKSMLHLLNHTNEIDVICDNSKSTPLMAAVYYGHSDCTKILLHKKANLNIANANGEDVFILASQTPKVDVLKMVLSVYLSKGNHIDKESPLDKLTLFMRAVLTQNTKNAKYLKKKGASINFKNSEGNTILHIALKKKLQKVIAF